MIETIILYDANSQLTTIKPASPNSQIEVYGKLSYSILAQSIRIVAIKDNMRYVIYYNGCYLVRYAPEKESDELD
jgi:hypothetical protein